MSQQTNSRQAVPSHVSHCQTPQNDICACGHAGPDHGTTGACRFGTMHGCTVFRSN